MNLNEMKDIKMSVDQLEFVEGKEIQKQIQYVYIQSDRSIGAELWLFTCKVIIFFVIAFITFKLVPMIFWQALIDTFNRVA